MAPGQKYKFKCSKLFNFPILLKLLSPRLENYPKHFFSKIPSNFLSNISESAHIRLLWKASY
jgi:hypothetical protein